MLCVRGGGRGKRDDGLVVVCVWGGGGQHITNLQWTPTTTNPLIYKASLPKATLANGKVPALQMLQKTHPSMSTVDVAVERMMFPSLSLLIDGATGSCCAVTVP
jgi:hypothetical protein